MRYITLGLIYVVFYMNSTWAKADNLASDADFLFEYQEKITYLIDHEEYAQALERVIWFHEHALEYEYSFYGVRLSFALVQWQRLGLLYAPAHVALIKERNDISHEVTSHPMQCESFDELIALNHVLDKSLQSIATLEAIHRQHEGVLSTGLLTGVLSKDVQHIAALKAIDRQHQDVLSTGVLTRCWSKPAEIMAVKFTSNILIEEYVGNLFDGI